MTLTDAILFLVIGGLFALIPLWMKLFSPEKPVGKDMPSKAETNERASS